MLVALVATPMLAGAQVPGSPVRYIVGFHTFPGLNVGDTYQGGTVLHVDPVLKFVAVSSANVDFKRDAYADANVRYVEHDGKYEALFTPNDPRYSEMYGPQQVRANLAWDTTLGSTAAKVCVVDTGVRTSHQDLGTARYLGGYDFVNNDADPTDDQGHGTHVAGTAAAGLNNAVGVAGMGNVGYYSVKVLDSGGSGWWSWVASGIRWCADNGGPRTVISLSLGGSSGDQAVLDAVRYAYNDKGMLIVAASGNGWCDNCVGYPARYAEVMAVSCTAQGEGACSFHSTGPEVEISAPGNDILSTCYETTSSYCRKSGTSMSTPHVSGIAALYWSHNQALTNAQLRTCLQTSAQDLGLPGRDNVFGYGELDAKNLFDSNCGSGSTRPANDNFAHAHVITTTPYERRQSTSGATTEAGEPAPCGNMAATVWYRWTPTGSGTATADTFGSDFDTVLAVYTGSWGSLVNVACNDDTNGGYQSQVSFQATAGTPYYFQLGGYSGATGSLTFRLQCASCGGPANDNFDRATTVDGIPYGQRQSTAGATLQSGEPQPCGAIGSTVWFRWTPSVSGTATVETFTSDYDTVLAAYTGSWGSLTNLACNDDDSGTLQSRIQFAVVAGQTYHIQAGGYNGATGTLQLTIQCSGCSNGPANDNFARASTITASPHTSTQDTTGATVESSEPAPCGLIAATVWYKFTPASSATVTVDTYGSNYDTVLAAYEGPALNSLTNLACNDDSAGGYQSIISFQVVAGQTYYVQAGGYRGATGSLTLRLDCGGCFQTGGNDHRRNAQAIAVPSTTTQGTGGFTTEPGEPLVPPMTATAWFKHTPGALSLPRVVTVHTVGSSYNTQVAVYAVVNDVYVPIAYNDDFPGQGTKSQVVFTALPGVTYYVQVGGVNGATGTLVLTA
ncbi:MAG TPA: S8 family serine peptidase, partial [Candidatus Thermoplasmatota archaeon]|nr:S8 family serine peptidase [Candidatus Thermoplasmatota archaeon]